MSDNIIKQLKGDNDKFKEDNENIKKDNDKAHILLFNYTNTRQTHYMSSKNIEKYIEEHSSKKRKLT